MINKKFKKIVIILILIVLLFPYTACLALTQAQAGEAIAKYAYSFCTTYGHQGDHTSRYSYGSERAKGYLLQPTSGVTECNNGCRISYTDALPMDCVAFVSTVIHQSLGIGSDTEFTYFIQPSQYTDLGNFDKVSGSAQPGDVYVSSGHVMIYLGEHGNGYTIAESGCGYNSSDSWHQTNGKCCGPTLTTTSTGSYSAYRIKSSLVGDVNESDIITDVSGGRSLSGAMGRAVEQSKFYYNGVPDGKYSVTSKNILEWIIEALADIFSFLVNILTYIIRMVFVGWTFLVENMLTDTIKRITGEEDLLKIDSTDYGKTGNKNTDDNITIERIIFDNVKVFDIDFFDFNV